MKIATLKAEYRNAGAMNELLAPCGFISEDIILTKRQDLFTVLEMRGVDPECMTPESTNAIVRRFESAIRILGPEFRVYQYLLKNDHPELPEAVPGHLSGERRQQWLYTKGHTMYSLKLYMVILRMHQLKDSPWSSVRGIFSPARALQVSRAQLNREGNLLSIATRSLAQQIEDIWHPRILGQKAATQFLQRLVNYDPQKAALGTAAAGGLHLDQQIAHSNLECWPTHLMQGDIKIKMLTMTESPASTMPHILRSLLSVECNYVIASEWKREDNHKMREQIHKQRRHHHMAKTSLRGSLFQSQNPLPHEVLVDDSKTAVVEELNNALKEIELNEKYFGRYSLIIALHHRSDEQLKKAAAKMTEIFSTHDAKLTEETYNMLNAWCAIVPGNYIRNYRGIYQINTCYADLSNALFAPATGDPWNRHLNRRCLATVETPEGVPFHLNLHHGDVGHTLVLGSIGSGKSFLSNFIVDDYQQYSPFTVIFDIGGSYRSVTEQYNGAYLHVGKDFQALTINPFSLEATPENLAFLFAFVRVLIEGRDAFTMTAEQRQDLRDRIEDMYQIDPDARTLRTLMVTLDSSYRTQLAEWVGTGRLAQYFDNVDDTLTIAPFQTFDFEGMDQSEVIEPLLFYILHRANASIYNKSLHDVPKLFVLDEAWKFFKNQTALAYIIEALKTWRKRNAVMLLATQSVEDFLHSGLKATVCESCYTKLFLANPGMSPRQYLDSFPELNSRKAAIIASLVPKKQILVCQPNSDKVINLNADPDAWKIYSNKPAQELTTI